MNRKFAADIEKHVFQKARDECRRQFEEELIPGLSSHELRLLVPDAKIDESHRKLLAEAKAEQPKASPRQRTSSSRFTVHAPPPLG